MHSQAHATIGLASPYLRVPALERLRRWICAHPTGTQLNTSVRCLARAVGCGAAAITPALRRMAQDGLIDHLTAPSGTLIVILISDAGPASSSDQAPDRHLAPDPAPPSVPPASEVITPLIAGQGDHGPDHPRGTKELYLDQDMQQQQHARERDFAVAEEPPAELTPTEWATIRALVPGYGEAQLKADLAKLKQRPGIHNPVGVLIAAYRRGEPIWGRDDLQAHNAAVTAQHVPPAAELPPPRRQRSDRAPAPAAPPAEPAQLAPHGALWDHLLLLMPDAGLVDWLCDGFALEVRPDATVLHCRSADHALVARDLRGVLTDALRDLGLPDALEIHAPEEAGQAVKNAEHPPTAPPVADHVAAPVPPAQLATAPSQPPTPPAPPASIAPPRRPHFSPWRAS